jgi:hypothetical protein
MAAINHPLPQARRGLPIPMAGARLNWWVFAAFAVFGLGALLPVLQNSLATTRGFDVQRLEAQQARLQGDIRVLESEVAELTSLGRIEDRATAIGLIPGEDPIFISVGIAGPEPAHLPAGDLPLSPPRLEATDSWWRSLFMWVLPGN